MSSPILSTNQRDDVLMLLWSDQIASTSRGSIPARLARGDEYIDLQHLERGVQHAINSEAPMGGILARKAVQPETWEQLAAMIKGQVAA